PEGAASRRRPLARGAGASHGAVRGGAEAPDHRQGLRHRFRRPPFQAAEAHHARPDALAGLHAADGRDPRCAGGSEGARRRGLGAGLDGGGTGERARGGRGGLVLEDRARGLPARSLRGAGGGDRGHADHPVDHPAGAPVPGAGGEGPGGVPQGAEVRGRTRRTGAGLGLRRVGGYFGNEKAGGRGMTAPRHEMELKEEAIRAHYPAGAALLQGLDHVPRIARPQVAEAAVERAPGVGARPRFRSTTPGLVTRPMGRAEGVRLVERIEGIGGADPIVDPVEAAVLQALRRALAIALAVGEAFSGQTGLAELKRGNLENRLPSDRKSEFSELLAAEALAVLSVFANATAFLLAPHATEAVVEIGAVEEVLTDNAQLALHGALWELDQDIAVFATEVPKLVPVVLAYAEQLMAKVKLRAGSAPRLQAFTGANYRVEADDFPIAGFEPARKARGTALVMTFRKPE